MGTYASLSDTCANTENASILRSLLAILHDANAKASCADTDPPTAPAGLFCVLDPRFAVTKFPCVALVTPAQVWSGCLPFCTFSFHSPFSILSLPASFHTCKPEAHLPPKSSPLSSNIIQRTYNEHYFNFSTAWSIFNPRTPPTHRST